MKTNRLLTTKILSTIIFTQFFCVTLFSQPGIHVQGSVLGNNPYLYNNDSLYVGIDLPSSSFKYMVLFNPSTKSWSYVNSVPYITYPGPITMKNNLEGVMIYSSQSKIYKTNDGWQSLTEVTNGHNGAGLSEIGVSDAGYIGYEETLKDLYFSADGTSWSMVFDGGSATNTFLRSKGNKVILFRGSLPAYISTNGGQTYSSYTFSTTFTGSTTIDFVMTSPDTMFVATNSHLHQSNDGGVNWTSKPFPTSTTTTFKVKNSNEFFISNSNQDYYISTDAGDVWQQINTPTTYAEAYNSFWIGDDLYVWPLYRTSDNGVNWEELFMGDVLNSTIYDIDFLDNEGLMGSNSGKINYSNDKGVSLRPVNSPSTTQDIMAVKILKNGDYVVGDRKGQIFYSTDKGANWSMKNSVGTTINPIKFCTSTDETIIVMTRSGQPMVSSNHGNTFSILNAGGGDHSQSVKPNGDIISAVGWFDMVTFQNKGWEISKFTPTGTKTIIDTFLVANEALVDIHMASDNIGYLITSDNISKANRIYKTTNGWNGGSTLISSIPAFGGASHYVNKSQIKVQTFGVDTIVLTNAGRTTFHYSVNGGLTWNESTPLDIHTDYPSLYPSFKRGYFFNTEEYMMALNNKGIYLNIDSDGGAVIGIHENSLSFFQNLLIYPNPAKDKISLVYPENNTQVEISIYDLMGRNLMNLSNYQANESIDISSLNEGIYLITARNKSGVISIGKFLKN